LSSSCAWRQSFFINPVIPYHSAGNVVVRCPSIWLREWHCCDIDGVVGVQVLNSHTEGNNESLACNCKRVRQNCVNGGQRWFRYLLPEASANAYINMSTEHLAYLGLPVRIQSGLTHEPSHLSVRMGLSVRRKSRPKAMRHLKRWW
jgi:hypothetical protein